jgi:hypothetical protein
MKSHHGKKVIKANMTDEEDFSPPASVPQIEAIPG